VYRRAISARAEKSVLNGDAEIERRKPVWTALSELWLDTELEPEDLKRIALVLKRSNYSVDQLRGIYLFEVAPVVYVNQFVVTGEWAAFNEEWLFKDAAKRARRRSLALRLFVKAGVGKWIMTYATEEHWATIVKLIESDA
jgi:hypothetical protein